MYRSHVPVGAARCTLATNSRRPMYKLYWLWAVQVLPGCADPQSLTGHLQLSMQNHHSEVPRFSGRVNKLPTYISLHVRACVAMVVTLEAIIRWLLLHPTCQRAFRIRLLIDRIPTYETQYVPTLTSPRDFPGQCLTPMLALVQSIDDGPHTRRVTISRLCGA